MPTLVKIQRKGQMTLPSELRAAIGVGEGDRLEASVRRGKIVLTPTLVIDRSGFPTAADEYTPTQRRVVERELAKGLEDIRKGRTYGPFNTVKEMVASIEENIRKQRATKRKAKPAR